MVRKVTSLICVLVLCLGFALTAQATEATPKATTQPIYGSLQTTAVISYFKGFLTKAPLNSNYVAWQSTTNEFRMLVGDLSVDSNYTFTAKGDCTLYTITYTSGKYSIMDTKMNGLAFMLNPQAYVVYSDVGEFPDFEERSVKYEILQTILLAVLLLSFVVFFFFRSR